MLLLLVGAAVVIPSACLVYGEQIPCTQQSDTLCLLTQIYPASSANANVNNNVMESILM